MSPVFPAEGGEIQREEGMSEKLKKLDRRKKKFIFIKYKYKHIYNY